MRTLWDDEKEEWYFSIVDVIEVLTDSPNPRRYWSDLKRKLTKEGSQLYAGIVQLKMISSDGKSYKTDGLNLDVAFITYLLLDLPLRNSKKYVTDTSFCR